MRSLLLILLLVSWSPCHAAGLVFQAFDFNQCRNWWFQDVGPGNSKLSFSEEFPGVVALQDQWAKSVAAGNLEKDWNVIEGTNVRSKANSAQERKSENVVCIFRDSSDEIECLGAPDRPLAGTKFRPLESTPKSDLKTFACYANCERAATKLIYQLPWEEGQNKRYAADYKRFVRKCGAQ